MKKLTPLQSIRMRCLGCCETSADVRRCRFDGKKEELCVLHPFRMGKGRPKLRQIKEYCLDCCNGSFNELKLCPVDACPLHFYRFGNNPDRMGGKAPSGCFKKGHSTSVEASHDRG